ncbi:uncharacterized protein MELLADRAFT_106795 [Melampsora larici-populina 98AG31]|uniref:Secreted protein n=1 Tax=Melampsora larici-populina (strain 98AG31 / pathotype 3-4-7) TaxID=747676 RepID=F4RMN6_MELLP|nr:uncharacterized protein MELLADRAFT_106795 [Melampsora larici-populina 98AG31]EGG06351.1 secreted protein [Melampsora larici-populina 98AG31]
MQLLKLLILLFLSLKFNSHVFGYPLMTVGSEITHASLGGLGRGADEITDAATFVKPGLQGDHALSSSALSTGTGKQIPEVTDSLFDGRQGQTSRDASFFENPTPVTDKPTADIFFRKPTLPYKPPTYKQAVSGQVLHSRLKPEQIDKLQPEELVEYLSNFNPEVKASREVWRNADQEVKDAELELSNAAWTEFQVRHPVPGKNLDDLLKEAREAEATGIVKIPENAKADIESHRAEMRRIAPSSAKDETLDKVFVRRLAEYYGISTRKVDIAIQDAKEAKDDAIMLAEMRKTSGYPLMDRMKIYSQKLAASIQKFTAKFSFKWPWRRSAAPNTQNQPFRLSQDQRAALRQGLRRNRNSQ